MTQAEYQQVVDDYEVIAQKQQRMAYRFRKFISQNIIFKWFCCCFKVQDELNKPFEDMTPMQKKYRIKKLWKKAKRVYMFQRLKFNLTDEESNNQDNEDEVIIKDNNVWKWWIIRQENTLP